MFCVMPATAVLLFVSKNMSLGLLTLWMASGTLLLARVAVLSWRYNSPEVWAPFYHPTPMRLAACATCCCTNLSNRVL